MTDAFRFRLFSFFGLSVDSPFLVSPRRIAWHRVAGHRPVRVIVTVRRACTVLSLFGGGLFSSFPFVFPPSLLCISKALQGCCCSFDLIEKEKEKYDERKVDAMAYAFSISFPSSLSWRVVSRVAFCCCRPEAVRFMLVSSAFRPDEE